MLLRADLGASLSLRANKHYERAKVAIRAIQFKNAHKRERKLRAGSEPIGAQVWTAITIIVIAGHKLCAHLALERRKIVIFIYLHVYSNVLWAIVGTDSLARRPSSREDSNRASEFIIIVPSGA